MHPLHSGVLFYAIAFCLGDVSASTTRRDVESNLEKDKALARLEALLLLVEPSRMHRRSTGQFNPKWKGL